MRNEIKRAEARGASRSLNKSIKLLRGEFKFLRGFMTNGGEIRSNYEELISEVSKKMKKRKRKLKAARAKNE
jgi:hypothetical protein